MDLVVSVAEVPKVMTDIMVFEELRVGLIEMTHVPPENGSTAIVKDVNNGVSVGLRFTLELIRKGEKTLFSTLFGSYHNDLSMPSVGEGPFVNNFVRD